MAVSLSKGGSLSLVKECENLGIGKLNKVAVGLGWDPLRGISMDLDAWALAITPEGPKRKNLVYFMNTVDSSRNIVHKGDNLTGAGDGDDETILIDLDSLPSNYEMILVGITIYMGKSKRQTFKDVKNGFIRIYDRITNKEICKYSEDLSNINELKDAVSMLFGVLYKENGEWKFRAESKPAKFSSITDAVKVYGAYALNNILENNTITNQTSKGDKTMAVSLSKGGKVSLAKVAADAGIQQLTKVVTGLGWDTNKYSGGGDFDLDASAFMCGANGKVRTEADFIFYNQKVGPGIEHMGDNRTGEGDGDDEQIVIDLTAVPADITEINFCVTIHTGQTFGQVENARIRLFDQVTNKELVTYDLSEDYSCETALVFAKLYRHNGEWKFNAIGSGFQGGLAQLCANFGVDIA